MTSPSFPSALTSRLAWVWGASVAGTALTVVACGMSGFAMDGDDGTGALSGGGGFSDGDASIDVPGDAAPSVTPPDFAALCGLAQDSTETSCVPGGDDEDCAPGGNPGVGGAGGGGEQALFCQVAIERGEPTPVCGPVGSVGAYEACSESLPCAKGLACVKTQDGSTLGDCRPYCCGDVEACPLIETGSEFDTYCVPNPLLDDPSYDVPVCQKVTTCELLLDTCPEGQKCAVVRENGTTSCVPQDGDGELCDPCPCAEGYVCHQLSQTCQKICHTNAAYGDECQGGSCLGGSMSFPDGFGVCTGGPAACE